MFVDDSCFNEWSAPVGDMIDNGCFVAFVYGNQTYSGNLSGTGDRAFTCNETLTLSGNNLGLSGGVSIYGGTLRMESVTAIPDEPSVMGGGNLDLNGYSLALAGITYDGNPTGTTISTSATSDTPATLYLTGANWLNGATICDGPNQDVALVLSGSGSSLTLSGSTANSCGGGVTIGNGTILRLGYGGDSGDIAANIVNYGTVCFDEGSAVTYCGVISGTGDVYVWADFQCPGHLHQRQHLQRHDVRRRGRYPPARRRHDQRQHQRQHRG